MLFQYGDDELFHSCIYFFKKNLFVEYNYKIHDKKILIVIQYLKKWNSELKNIWKFEIIIDHKNFEYFLTTRKLSEHHVQWIFAVGQI